MAQQKIKLTERGELVVEALGALALMVAVGGIGVILAIAFAR